MKRVLYLLREAIRGLRANRTSTVIGIMTTAFTIASFGVFVLLYHNVRTIAGTLQDQVQIIIYLKDEISSKERSTLETMLKQESNIETLAFISKDQALKDFHEQFPSESYLLEGIGDNPLPASFVAHLTPSPHVSDLVSAVASRVKVLSGVEHVRYSRDWVERLTLFTSYLEIGALGVGLILSIASLTIISNTVRLAFWARREEIEILRLIGATGAFISIPYLIEGAVLGTLGGLLSLGLLRGGFEIVKDKISDLGWVGGLETAISFFPIQLSCMLVLAGLILGCIGSALSVYGWAKIRT
ncbi:MAG: ABC transporter permease [Nitrospirales bacterium]|nr:ABC transporter permease [Nitrospira sp.]MDR4501672.1 ABC transporter permease [Nitrospirales bacterium]